MIEKIINFGETVPRPLLIELLVRAYENQDPQEHSLQKALGSLGGAVFQRFIAYDEINDSYTRIKK